MLFICQLIQHSSYEMFTVKMFFQLFNFWDMQMFKVLVLFLLLNINLINWTAESKMDGRMQSTDFYNTLPFLPVLVETCTETHKKTVSK